MNVNLIIQLRYELIYVKYYSTRKQNTNLIWKQRWLNSTGATDNGSQLNLHNRKHSMGVIYVNKVFSGVYASAGVSVSVCASVSALSWQ